MHFSLFVISKRILLERECKFGAISMVNEQDAKQSEVQA